MFVYVDNAATTAMSKAAIDAMTPHQTVLMDRQVCHLKALLLQTGQGVEDGVVLNGVRDDVFLPRCGP